MTDINQPVNGTMKQMLKLIRSFERKHKKVYDDEGNTDCPIIENEIWRVAPKRKDWLGDDESYRTAIKEQAEKDKNIRCYVCEFIKQMKQFTK